jgi:hypothetical protein
MTDNDSHLGPQTPPTPHVDFTWQCNRPPWHQPTVGIPIAPENDQADTDSRLAIMHEIRLALEPGRPLKPWERTPDSAAKWNSVGQQQPPEPAVVRSLKNVMDAYAFVARSVVRERYWHGQSMTFKELMDLAPWKRVPTAPVQDADNLPQWAYDRLERGLDFWPSDQPMHGLEQDRYRRERDIALHRYAEQIAWAQAGLDEIRDRERMRATS